MANCPAMSRLLLALPVLLAACGGGLPEVCTDGVDRPPTPGTSRPHAHNDYAHEHPLEDALAQGFTSVEADVFYARGRFEVSHRGLLPKGTLERLYLEPLQRRASAGGLLANGEGFTLWIDLKDADDGLVDALHTLLDRYPMLTVFDDVEGVTKGAVTVVLTGNAKMKEAFVASRPRRRAIRDSNDFSPSDPPADARWDHYALKWSNYMDWDGKGTLPPDQSERLACIVNRAHALGRKVRFFGAPDRPEVWSAWQAHGVDFLHTDELRGMRAHLRP